MWRIFVSVSPSVTTFPIESSRHQLLCEIRTLHSKQSQSTSIYTESNFKSQQAGQTHLSASYFRNFLHSFSHKIQGFLLAGLSQSIAIPRCGKMESQFGLSEAIVRRICIPELTFTPRSRSPLSQNSAFTRTYILIFNVFLITFLKF